MVLGEAAPSEGLAARAFEVEAGGVHEHDVERGEEVAPGGEQLLLQDVLHAARRKRRRGVLLVFGQFLAEPRHRAIEMMQIEARRRRRCGNPRASGRRRDPSRRRRGGAARSGTPRAPARTHARGRSPGARSRPGSPSPPTPARRRAPDRCAASRRRVASPRSSASSTIAFSANRAPERSSRSSCPLACSSSIRPSVAITCWRTEAPRAGSRRSADTRDRRRSSCGNTWRGTGRRLDRGAHSIRPDSAKLKGQSRMTWHYILVPAPHRLKSYQRLTGHERASTVEDQSEYYRSFGGARLPSATESRLRSGKPTCVHC